MDNFQVVDFSSLSKYLILLEQLLFKTISLPYIFDLMSPFYTSNYNILYGPERDLFL